ncbi:hypothetical protein MTBSS4_510001 [Magnetospirillum sp. SS-4]|nr:hypothetical protein MTBSS4_510001 [Magnetospirillum sp. SS-4]
MRLREWVLCPCGIRRDGGEPFVFLHGERRDWLEGRRVRWPRLMMHERIWRQ